MLWRAPLSSTRMKFIEVVWYNHHSTTRCWFWFRSRFVSSIASISELIADFVLSYRKLITLQDVIQWKSRKLATLFYGGAGGMLPGENVVETTSKIVSLNHPPGIYLQIPLKSCVQSIHLEFNGFISCDHLRRCNAKQAYESKQQVARKVEIWEEIWRL